MGNFAEFITRRGENSCQVGGLISQTCSTRPRSVTRDILVTSGARREVTFLCVKQVPHRGCSPGDIQRRPEGCAGLQARRFGSTCLGASNAKPKIEIRREKPADVSAVREVHRAAFGQDDEATIVDTLRSSCDDLVSLVAEEDERIVGHILFSPVTIEGENGQLVGMGLAPMAVHPDRQRQGIGSSLIQAGLDTLRDRGVPFVVVLGHPHYYRRFGFTPAARYNVRSKWEVPDDVFMLLELESSALREFAGLASYRPEFG